MPTDFQDTALGSILVQGFKSIENQELTLGRVNVLLGANGAGKSNLVAFFRLLADLASENLQVHVGRSGGATSLLYQGPKVTPRIVATVRMVAPFFRDFVLEPSDLNAERIQLRWRAMDSDYDFGAHQLSDGTLRFMALASIFLQPERERPEFIVLDEPELGLHPMAIRVLAGLVRSAAATSCQVLLATQSTTVLDQFEPEEVIVAELERGRSVFKRPNRDQLDEWLEEYSLSELREKNIIGGRP